MFELLYNLVLLFYHSIVCFWGLIKEVK